MDIKKLSYEDSIVRMAKLVEHICDLRKTEHEHHPCINCALSYFACEVIKKECERIENKGIDC